MNQGQEWTEDELQELGVLESLSPIDSHTWTWMVRPWKIPDFLIDQLLAYFPTYSATPGNS